MIGDVRDDVAIELDAVPVGGAGVGNDRVVTLASPTANTSSDDVTKSMPSGRLSQQIGKYGGCISPSKVSRNDWSPWGGPKICTFDSGWCTGTKNGRPCTWSQCRWVTRTVASTGV